MSAEDGVPEIVELAITPELDLHTFRPGDVAGLLTEYFTECRVRGILAVRVVHGKGTGALRELVHGRLALMPELVESWAWPAGAQSGGWGATWVYLRAAGATQSG
jgi:DNA-nicking Smr family endonuclease